MRKMLSIAVLLGANLAAAAQTDMPKPAQDFALPREERIKLAESAAPPELADHATVYLLFWYGVGKSARPKENADDLATFLAGPVRVLGFEEGDAREAGEVRASLERIGKPIGAYDMLIAGQALSRKMTLVTANAREFRRVKGLVWEDWGKS
jgi:tRNA(fMet)-specific endonuclease VapC